jgi:prepilin-type N-terminal cleavage/methylation domain-containing protein/prepilin-type processing-associated H-X9-DG protein
MLLGPVSSLKEKLRQMAGKQFGYFTAKQAIELGYSKDHHSYHVRQCNWQRVSHGLFRLPEYTDTMKSDFTKYSLWSRNLFDQPQGVISHYSALAFHGFGIHSPQEIHLTVPARFRKEIPPEVIIHNSSLNISAIESHGSFMVTRLGQALVDMRPELESKGEWDGILEKVVAEGRLSCEKMASLGLLSSTQAYSGHSFGTEFCHGKAAAGEPGRIGSKNAIRSDKSNAIDPVSEGVWKMIYDKAETGRRRSKAGFTLVELLVVVAIISILAGLLLPIMGKAIETARGMKCMSNFKQVGVAQTLYSDGNSNWIVPAILYPWGSGSWSDGLLYFGNLAGYGGKTNYGVMYESITNMGSSTFVCPSEPVPCGNAPNFKATHHGMNTWLSGWMGTANANFNKARKASAVKNASVTILSGDSTERYEPIINTINTFSYRHGAAESRVSPSWSDPPPLGGTGKTNILYFDGHVAGKRCDDLYIGNIYNALKDGFDLTAGSASY